MGQCSLAAPCPRRLVVAKQLIMVEVRGKERNSEHAVQRRTPSSRTSISLQGRHDVAKCPAMKVKEADILIVPGYTNSGSGHWQSRWQAKLSTARRVEQAEWTKPVREHWCAALAEEVNRAERP